LTEASSRTPGARRQVRLCTSSELAVPAAVGLFRPAIVFPAWLLPQLSAGEIEMIVRHEMAHLRRWDDWSNLAQKIVKAVFFFHPAVWWIENRLTLEREMACDDMVLAQTGSPKEYASSLISFAEKLHTSRGLALAQALVSRMHEMSLRLAQILDVDRPHRTDLWKPVVGLSAGLLIAVLGAAPYLPRMVAFEQAGNETPRTAESMQPEGAWQHHLAGTTMASVQPAAQQQNAAPRPTAILAVFHPRAAQNKLGARKLKAATPKTAPVLQAQFTPASVAQEETPAQPPIYIQTTEFHAPSASSPGFWKLCIWKVDRSNPSDRQLESAIVVSWI
jgi:hypothetical protein